MKNDKDYLQLNKENTYYFSGIGGISMSALANILVNKGFKVIGSDIQKSDITEQLESRGIKINYKQIKNNINDNYVIIKSDAIGDNNEEIIQAKKKELCIIHRAVLLDYISKDKSRSLAISGTHGKTTTTSMISHLLIEMDYDPTCLIGGIIPSWKSNYRIGNGELFVYEACEAFNNLNYYTPDYSIITSIDEDHLDFYGNLENILAYFINYINRIAKDGLVILNIDDENIYKISKYIKGNIKYYSISNNKKYNEISNIVYRANNINIIQENNTIYTSFDLKIHNLQKSYRIPIFGEYNIQNAIASICMIYEITKNKNILNKIENAFSNFKNAKRRFEYLGSYLGANIYNDYSHHPKEIFSLLSTVKNIYKNVDYKIITIFQPHLYTRTQALYKDFAKSLSLSDFIILTPIYPAREEPIDGVSSDLIYKELLKYKSKDSIKISNTLDNSIEILDEVISKNDIVITMGAGNIGNLYKKMELT